MKTPSNSSLLALFGAIVVASGLYRYLGSEGGEKGLWFGLVMGGLALAGAFLMRRGHWRIGLACGGLAVAFVAGWFGFEALVRKGWSVAEPRQLIVLAAAILTGILLGVRRPRDA